MWVNIRIGFLLTVAGTAQVQDAPLPIKLVPRAQFVVGRGEVSAVDLHVESKRIVTGGAQGDLVLQTHPGGKVCWQRPSGDHWFRDVRFSPDGQLIAAAGRKLSIWSIEGKNLREWPTSATPMDWSPDGKLLAFNAGSEGGVTVVQARTWKVKHEFPEVSAVEALCFAADGLRLLAGTSAGHTVSLDLTTGRYSRLHEWRAPDEAVKSLQLYHGKVLRGHWRGAVHWGSLRIRHGKYLFAAAARGDRILTAGATRVRAWNRRGELLDELPFGAVAMRFQPDGAAVFLATNDRRLVRWDFESVTPLNNPHPSRVGYLTFSRDSQYLLAVAAAGKAIVRCEVATGVSTACSGGTPVGPGFKGSEVIVRDGRELLVRDASTWRSLRRLPKAPALYSRADILQLAPDGKTLLLGNRFFNTANGHSKKVDYFGGNLEVVWSRKGHAAVSHGIGIDSGSGLRVFGPSRMVAFEKKWVSPSGFPLSGIATMDFAPSGDALTYVAWNRQPPNEVGQIDTATMQQTGRVRAPVTWWRYLDERLALVCTPTGSEVWDAKDLRRLGALDQPLGTCDRLMLSPDRRWLAAAFRLHVKLFEIRRLK